MLREGSPELTDQERDARTVMVMQLPRKANPPDVIRHFESAGACWAAAAGRAGC